MCETCGCGDSEIVPIEVQERILSDNDAQAAHNRSHFGNLGVLAINLMGSPGAGKTAVLEATAKASAGNLRLGAVSGDLATERDADRLNASGIASATITTGSACHLDARLVHHALHHFPSGERDVFFIENVGNLVCPAIYDLGQTVNVVALSATEGPDKPLKYPVMFRAADLMLLSKSDLLDVLDDFDTLKAERHLRELANPAQVLTVSARRPDSLENWLHWLRQTIAARRGGAEMKPSIQAEGAALHHHN